MPLPTVGGQAVIEGVMLRGPAAWAVAVRAPDGAIRVWREPLPPEGRWAAVPFLRGLAALATSLRLGIRSLRWSAAVATGQEVRFGPVGVVAAVVAVGVFGVLPGGAAQAWGQGWLPGPVIDAALGVVLLVGYIAAVGRLAEIRRVFAYHGAEHQVVAAYEAAAPRTPEAAAAFSTRHPRCGTTFLLVVAIVAAAAHALLGGLPVAVVIGLRVALLPVIVAVAYELQRALSAVADHRVGRTILAPGLALQGLTTRVPDLDQLEVALAALDAATGPLTDPATQAETVREPVAPSR